MHILNILSLFFCATERCMVFSEKKGDFKSKVVKSLDTNYLQAICHGYFSRLFCDMLSESLNDMYIYLDSIENLISQTIIAYCLNAKPVKWRRIMSKNPEKHIYILIK